MRSITQQMKGMRKHKKIGLMTHVVAGYPSLQDTERLVVEMEKVGVDFVEIQIPFSDPIADGPTIMKANDTALKNKVTITDALQLMERLTKKVSIPLLFMGYYNSVYRYGVEQFCTDAAQAGARGLIIPDIPMDEEDHEHFIAYCRKYGLAPIRVLSPTSTESRIIDNVQVAQDFIYCTAIAGTTGARTTLDNSTRQFLNKMKAITDVSLAVGFGISHPDHLRALIGSADIAVVGSAVIQKIEECGVDGATSYLQTLTAAVMK